MFSTNDKKVYYSIYDSSYGNFFIASSEQGLCELSFIDKDYDSHLNRIKRYFGNNNIIEDNSYNLKVLEQLNRYFKGETKEFDLNLHLLGTDFQKQVWNILLEIKHGEVWTYGDVALKMGSVKKSRAVGGAIGKNPIVIIIPCHRVIGSNGKLTGFSAPGGVGTKRKLLNLEGHHF